MKVYHQTGHNLKWNIDSLKDKVGDGLIFSPVNIDADKLLEFSKDIKKESFLDPQLYLLNQAKGSLETYPYFPGNLKPDFATVDLDSDSAKLAKVCVDYQQENDFEYIVIPTKYYEENPTNYLLQCTEYFVIPFTNYIGEINNSKKILLSVIVKNIMLVDTDKRNEILNWITGHIEINGVYLIFENNFSTKQIKDFDYLFNALNFIKVLKDNELEVHLGYTNTESFIYNIAMPDSITIGSYENLRSFGIRRFQDLENGVMRSPNARLYSGKLLQWIDYGYVQSMKRLVDDYENFFEESKHSPLNFAPEENWQFKKTAPYMHFFYIFYNQILDLPNSQKDRISYVKECIKKAIGLYKEIENKDVLLDQNSDGSHLNIWYNVVSSFQRDLNR